MASKVTPLYAETITLLRLWALEEQPAYQSKFKPDSKSKAYAVALSKLVEDGALTKIPKGRKIVYSITESGKTKLAQGLASTDFVFTTNVGAKTTNPLLKWLRQGVPPANSARDTTQYTVSQNGNHANGSTSKIDSYEEFSKTALETYEQLNQDYNLGDLVPIYRIRREMGDRLSRREFNEWLLKVQRDELVQLMGGELPNVTPDQIEDSVSIPGGGTRLYVKRL